MDEGQNWGNPAKYALIRAAGTVLNETANKIRQGGSGKRRIMKKKKKCFSRSTLYKGKRKGHNRRHK